MSAETLARAAAEIRSDWNGRYGGGWQKVVAFNLAVADLLDEIALRWEYVEERELALAVARAYLGEDDR